MRGDRPRYRGPCFTLRAVGRRLRRRRGGPGRPCSRPTGRSTSAPPCAASGMAHTITHVRHSRSGRPPRRRRVSRGRRERGRDAPSRFIASDSTRSWGRCFRCRARQRQALVMREFEGRSYDEIAARLGASNGAVRQLLEPGPNVDPRAPRRADTCRPWSCGGRRLPCRRARLGRGRSPAAERSPPSCRRGADVRARPCSRSRRCRAWGLRRRASMPGRPRASVRRARRQRGPRARAGRRPCRWSASAISAAKRPPPYSPGPSGTPVPRPARRKSSSGVREPTGQKAAYASVVHGSRRTRAGAGSNC